MPVVVTGGGSLLDDVTDGEQVKGNVITLNATINNGASRMTYDDNGSNLKFAWSNKESFNLYQGTASDAAVFLKNAEGNTFSGTAPTEGTGSYYAVYGGNVTNTNGVLTVDISDQIGTNAENGINTFMVAETDDLTKTLSFEHKLAVLKLNLTLPEGASGTGKITVMGLHNKATYTLNGGTYTFNTEAWNNTTIGDITVSGGVTGFSINDNKITAYVAVFPQEVKAGAAMLRVETESDTYIYTIHSARTLTAGKVIPVNVTMVRLEAVDLGLPSGKKWSTMNIGANSPLEQGNYYQWATIEPYGAFKSYSQPVSSGIEGNPKYDVARAKWGGKWRMPTSGEYTEMINNTAKGVDPIDGIKGRTFTNTTTGKYIFIRTDGDNNTGYYWTASCRSDNYPNRLAFNVANNDLTGSSYRSASLQQLVRAIYVEE